MSDATIFYTGIFCFSMMLVGFALTIHEFRNMARSRGTPARPQETTATLRKINSIWRTLPTVSPSTRPVRRCL